MQCSLAADTDNDGFPDGFETFLGTSTTQACASTAAANDEGPPDAWPPDFNDDQGFGSLDFAQFIPYVGSSAPSTYSARFDLSPDGVVGSQDILRAAAEADAALGTCTGF